MDLMRRLDESLRAMRERAEIWPKTGIVLGSGLSPLAERIERPQFLPYGEIPHMKRSTAPGHEGRFVLGEIAGVPLICMQGRLHYYEGHSMEEIAYPIRLMRQMGIQALILTNAAGGINEGFRPGDIMLLRDHINWMGNNPLIGPNEADLGERFFDMGRAYPEAFRAIARESAKGLGIPMKEGVYLATSGPNFETPAEIRMMRALGADAVGMSTVPEVLAAAHMGLPVLALSLISNLAAGMKDEVLSGEDVIRAGLSRAAAMSALVADVIARMG
ncbi:MAG: purine-nucleoside phosphorylase [Christensenellaceae bacterium]|nr:purine-nucleoside phosphorylase [Christensenellaceae bacterium]